MKRLTKKKTARPSPVRIRRATLVEILESGEILVDLDGRPPRRMLCEFLQSAASNQLALRPGDRVLVYPASKLEDRGCVLGKVGPYQEPETRRVQFSAQDELTIQCGEGSITIRKTGQVLIKGLDIVSHARRSNRVRGGSIQLN